MQGWQHARGDAVIIIDADGQHPPSLIPDMVRGWQESRRPILWKPSNGGAVANRYPVNLAPSYYIFLNKLSGFHFKGASDFKLMNRKAVDAWREMHERNVFFRGMTVWMGSTPCRFLLKWCHAQRVNSPGPYSND